MDHLGLKSEFFGIVDSLITEAGGNYVLITIYMKLIIFINEFSTKEST
jgi:hypothetical protein